MKIVELALLPSCLCEDVGRAKSSSWIRNMVNEKDGMVDGERPKCSISNGWPVNGSMKHHCASDRHDGANVPFGYAIVVMGADTSKSHYLSEGRQVSCEFTGSEDLGVVSQVLLWRDTILSTGKFKSFFRLQCFVSVEIHLHLNVDETGGVVDEDTTTSKHLI